MMLNKSGGMTSTNLKRMKLIPSIATAAAIGTFFTVSQPAEAQWSIRNNASMRFNNCIIRTASGIKNCIGVSFTSGDYARNLHFDLNSVPQRGVTFAYPKSTRSGSFQFYAIADSSKNVRRVNGNCIVKSSSVECVTEDGQIHAKAWQ